MSIKYRLLAAATLLILGLSLAFTSITCVKEQRALLQGLDEKLHLAACLAAESLPDNYHDRIMDGTSVSAKEYERIVDKNDKLCRECGLQYLWSCMIIGDQIVFTTATSPTKDVTKGDYAPFFARHRDPGAFAKVFKTMKPDYSSFHNEWGDGRMLLIPAVDSKGRRYCFGASVSFDEVNSALRQTLKSALALCGWVLAAGIMGSIALSTAITRRITLLTKAADSIAHGDMDQIIKPGGSCELKSLSHSISVMRDSIHQSISKLKSEIAERQSVEATLRKAEARYRILFEESPDGIAIINPKTARIVEFNESAHRQLGYSRAEFSRTRIFDLYASESTEDIRCRIAEAVSTGRADFETQMRTRTGEIRHVHVTAQILHLSLHPVYHCVWRDITERKAAEDALHASEMQFRSMSSAAQDAVIMMDDRGNISFWNDAAVRIFGYTAQEAIGRKLHDLIIPQRFYPAHIQAMPRFLSTGQGNAIGKLTELTALRKQGTEFPLELSLASFRQGGRWHAVGIIRDITKRKAAEEALKRANHALLAIKECTEALARARNESGLLKRICQIIVELDGVEMAWVVFSENDKIKSVHPAVRSVSDSDFKKRLKQAWGNALREEGPTIAAIRNRKAVIDRDLLKDSDEKTRARDSTSLIALPLVWKGRCLGALSIFSSRADAFNDEEVDLFTQLTTDLAYGIISLRTRAEHEQLQGELLKISERSKQIIAQELHDGLCQHLTGTALMSKLLQQRLAKTKNPEAELAEEICDLLTTAVNEARNMSHGLHPVKGGPSGLMDALAVMAGTVTKLFHVRCSFRCTTPVFIDSEVVATHLFRIAQESVSNAIKHGQAERVLMTLAYTGEGIALSVRDNGIGIPAEVPTEGMGMQIMRHRASAIGAAVTVRRSGKRGTLVQCTLPFDS
jgi:PAS domain S-box-containing protein